MSICFSKEFLLENMMGPNAVTMCEELTKDLPLSGCRRILDLGCGKGLSSLFLADRLDAEVFAVDLWTPASENLARFEQMGYGDRIVPLHAGAEALPFADGYFDAVVSIDAYHYFGREKGFLDAHIAPLVKEGGNDRPGLSRTQAGACTVFAERTLCHLVEGRSGNHAQRRLVALPFMCFR